MMMKYLKKFKRFQLLEPLFYLNKKESVKEYRRIRKESERKDRLFAEQYPEFKPLHEKLDYLRRRQIEEWDNLVYCDGYFYQGFKKIGITGIKPTEERIKNYGIAQFFDKNKTVLDIGSNSGFIVCHLAELCRHADGIELNPFLVDMSNVTKDFLDITNANFIQGDFVKHDLKRKYDIVLSLSNHHTVDGNLKLEFESYIKKIFESLNQGGILFFESHDINGGDADLEDKFDVASKYFDLCGAKMVRSFVETDIDKLFAVFKRRDEVGKEKNLDFSLREVRTRYHYKDSLTC